MSTLAGADVAQRFINEQIQEYESRLRNAEKARENFKRANFGLLPGEGDQISQVQSANNMLADAKLQLNEALSRKSVLEAQLNQLKDSDEDWGVTDFNETGVSEEAARIESLKNIKKELLVKYTDNHPQVLSINKTINELQKRKQAADDSNKDDMTKDMFSTPSVMANPYVQTIKIALNEAEAEVATYQARVNELKQRVDRIGEELNTRLTIETELQNLNRDYDSIKSNYEKLLGSREQAKMSEKVDNQAEALKFKIADAPNTPLKPSSPNRPLLFTGVLVAGVLFGFVTAFLLYFIKPTIMSTLQLRQITGLPVLGSVSLKSNSTRIDKNRKDAIKYGITAAGLLMIYIGFMAIDMFDVKLVNLPALLQSVN
ncbi:MAG: GNVR domain-containing protein [Methylococcales bacterium]